ncbi:MarR family winged helix-turn-helix transcriptional regulator [Pendulispora albinea]|uniref:MarR family transcriptional regulator n=1 Tax=Pendulispora albinea TaxID=2741071 RepID=A0ABZ2LVN4_9BACT
MQNRPDRPPRALVRPTAAFLLAQVGAHARMKFAERLLPLDISPPHAGILRAVGFNAGMSQQALSGFLGILPSRLVALVDELQSRGLIERRDSPEDRRVYALHLTAKGIEALEALGRVAREHDVAICAALNEGERQQLALLLGKIAEHEGLVAGVHPGYRMMGQEGPEPSDDNPAGRQPRGRRTGAKAKRST